MGWTTEGSEFESRYPGSTQPPIQWVPEVLFPSVKRPGRKADHSPPSSSEVNNTRIHTSTAFMA
jgi:hypothetical protein